MNEHEGHDQDCAHEQECACGEIILDPARHHCLPGRRPDGAVYVDSGEGGELYLPLPPERRRAVDPLLYDVEPITFYHFDPPPECDHQWAEAQVTYERDGQRIPIPTGRPVHMCTECGQISTDHQEVSQP